VPAALEPALPDPAGHGGAAGVEELVQLAQRDVMGRRDLRRGQVGLAQVLLDERGDLEHQSPVGPVRVRRAAVEPFGQYRAEQVQHVARQPDPDPEIPGVHLVQQVRHLHQERADQRGQPAGRAGQPGRGQPGQPGFRPRKSSPLPGVETSSGTNVFVRMCFQYSKR
jgi:hypothetical protein